MREQLRRLLTSRDLLSAERFEECVNEEAHTGESLDRILIVKGYLTEIDMLRAFGEVLGLEVIESLHGVQVPPEFVNQVPVHFARSYNLIALASNGHSTRVATCSPLSTPSSTTTRSPHFAPSTTRRISKRPGSVST